MKGGHQKQRDQLRVVRRRVILAGVVLQICVIRGEEIIPIGPMADSLDELRLDLMDMLAACNEPIMERA